MSSATHPVDSDCLAYTAADLARVLHVSERHVWSLHSRGLLPRPIRLSRSARWVRAEIEAWLSAGCPPRDRWEQTKNRA